MSWEDKEPRLAALSDLLEALDLSEERAPVKRLKGVLLGVEAFVERYCGHTFAPLPPFVDGEDTGSPVTKTFAARGRTTVKVPDLRVALSVTLDGGTLDPDYGYVLEQTGGDPAMRLYLTRTPYLLLGDTGALRIVGRWGMLETPDDIRESVITLASRKWRERDAAYSDQVITAEGSVMAYFRQLPGSVKVTLDAYRDTKIAVV
jgi:hypothetical protein